MKCKDCEQSYVRLDESCTWMAMCNRLGSGNMIGVCNGDSGCNGDCEDREPPEWDCDLGQDNQYCVHYVD